MHVDDFVRLYSEKGMTLEEVSKVAGKAISTVRYHIKRAGLLRSPKEASILAGRLGRKGAHLAGKKKPLSPETIKKMTERKREWAAQNSKGVSLKPSGYLEFTRGEHKFRRVHVVVMENHLGRTLAQDEVVHHIDHNRSNNDISNLQVMTKSEHARLHAFENLHKRKRTSKGRFL